VATGREAVLQAIGGTFVPFQTQTTDRAERVYLSDTGAVEAAPLKQPSSDIHRLVAIDEFGPSGIRSQTFALSELAWSSGNSDDPRMLGVRMLARDYAQAWSAGSAEAVKSLYAPTATLTDGLAGDRDLPVEDIVALAAEQQGSSSPLEIDMLPGLSGPAVFVLGGRDPTYQEPVQSMTMLVTAGDREGCPGHMAIRLELNAHGRITQESRYHRVDTLTRCMPGGVAESSGTAATRWWDEIAIPPPVAKVQTGALDLNGGLVPVFNSTPGLDRLITWAAGRFPQAGLTTPTLTEVAFYDARLDICRNIRGFTVDGSLALCFVEETACTDQTCTGWEPTPKATALHEFGHAWMATLQKETQQQFTDQAGLARWADKTDYWGERGVELAAETIAWALMDEPYTVNPKLGERPCDELGALFETLTGEPVPTSTECAN
jgi:hypothetical protein